jgi:hypothetical protein
MLQQAKTPDAILPGPLLDDWDIEESDRGISPVDRIALTMASLVAILILGIVGLTCKSEKQPMPAAAVVAMSSYIGLPAFALDRRIWNNSGKE